MELRTARIGKAHGVRGEVTVELLTDQPEERFYPGAVFSLLSPEPELKKLSRTLTLESSFFHSGTYILAFEGVESRNAVELLRNHFLVSDINLEVEGDGEDEFHVQQLIGLDIVDIHGEKLGTVEDILNLPGQDVVVTHYRGIEKLIPFVMEIVPTIDLKKKQMIVTPPSGLFEDSEAIEAVDEESPRNQISSGKKAELGEGQ
jgi:16S rRNA processing protein RimM